MNDLDEFEAKQERPKFLKVLCILTFIGSGWAAMGSVISYLSADSTAHTVNMVQVRNDTTTNHGQYRRDSTRRKNEAPRFVKRLMSDIKASMTPGMIRKAAIGTLLSSLFCLCGALLMWYLKRSGYFLYIIGVIIGIAAPFYLFGTGVLGVVEGGIPAFFGLLFVIFYSMNFRSLK